MAMNWYKGKKIWFVFGTLLLLLACETEESEQPDIYFDSEAYLDEEWPYLAQIDFARQELNFNEQIEYLDSVPVDSTSFKELFQLFKKANINKVIYSQEYMIDTFWLVDPDTNENLEVINYFTENTELPVAWFH